MLCHGASILHASGRGGNKRHTPMLLHLCVKGEHVGTTGNWKGYRPRANSTLFRDGILRRLSSPLLVVGRQGPGTRSLFASLFLGFRLPVLHLTVSLFVGATIAAATPGCLAGTGSCPGTRQAGNGGEWLRNKVTVNLQTFDDLTTGNNKNQSGWSMCMSPNVNSIPGSLGARSYNYCLQEENSLPKERG